MAESWFATLKLELVDRRSWATRAQLRRAVFEFVEVFYNRQRLHSSLNYLTPAEYEERSHLSSWRRPHNQTVRQTGSIPLYAASPLSVTP